MADETPTPPEGQEDDDANVPLQAQYILFCDAGPGEMRGTATVDGKEQEVVMPLVIVAYSHRDDIQRFAMNFKDAANMTIEILQSMAYRDSEWAKRVLGAISLINKELTEEFGDQGEESDG